MTKSYWENWSGRFAFWNSLEGKELSLSMISQGYDDTVFWQWVLLLGSYFSAAKQVNELKGYLREGG